MIITFADKLRFKLGFLIVDAYFVWFDLTRLREY